MQYFFAGCAFWGCIALILYELRPGAALSNRTVISGNRKEYTVVTLTAACAVLLCIMPMSINPIWNGEIPGHRNQYEVLAESILDGRLDLDYGDMDPRLLEMDNPYNKQARDELGVQYHWDHALYNGKYYMYFGVVPVFLLFLPFRAITGTNLTTYHATQCFTTFIIIGFFSLFHLLSKKAIKSTTLAVYLSLSVAASFMSVWYFAMAPALYCTAISAGVCMQIWSVFFYLKAMWDSSIKQRVQSATWGSLLGALSFGCRPTVALVSILLSPLFIYYFVRKHRFTLKQIIFVFSPYVLIGALLMLYNYARFENPFEFGQSYQLTYVDQTSYSHPFEGFSWNRIINDVTNNYLGMGGYTDSFPFLSAQSLFFNFPICAVAAICFLQKDTLCTLRKMGLLLFSLILIVCAILITAVQVLQSPGILERYRSDIYWIAGILSFVAFTTFLGTCDARHARVLGFVVSIMAVTTVIRSFLLWASPFDSNYTMRSPEALNQFAKVLSFGAAGVN